MSLIYKICPAALWRAAAAAGRVGGAPGGLAGGYIHFFT
ncbi:dihydroorotate dehydrogenase, partial [Methylobacterium indicum]